MSGRKASEAEATAGTKARRLETGCFEWFRWDVESMLRNAGGEVDKAVGPQTRKDLECHAEAFRIHLVGNRELLKILKGDMTQNIL